MGVVVVMNQMLKKSYSMKLMEHIILFIKAVNSKMKVMNVLG